jgi:hypothetical protein
MWRFFILSSPSLNKKKVSKRSFALNAKEGNIYPSPGHRSCIIPADIQRKNQPARRGRATTTRAGRATQRRGRGRQDQEEEEEEEADDNEDEGLKVSVLTLGGAIRQTDKVWEECSKPVETTFTVYDNDVVADDKPSLPVLTGKSIMIIIIYM